MKSSTTIRRTLQLLLLICIAFSGLSCTKTYYVRQNQTYYHDYERIKYNPIRKKEARKPKTYRKKMGG